MSPWRGWTDCLAQLREQGITLVTVLHEMGELAGLVDRTVTLADGRVVASRPLGAHGPEGEPDCDHLDPHSAAPAYVHHHAPNLHLNQAEPGGRHDH